MTESKKESQRGKAPKAGKGTGRKRGVATMVVSVRLPVDSVNMYKINSEFIYKAVLDRLSKKTGLDFNAENAQYDPDYKAESEGENKRTELKDKEIL